MLPLMLLVACGEAPPPEGGGGPIMGATEVVLFTSPDARTWTRQPGALATKLVSLGLSVRDDGALWVTGMDHSGTASWWDRTFGPSTVDGLIFDGESWSPAQWPVEDPDARAFIDPQWLGDELWYVARPGTEGDPVQQGIPNTVRTTSADGPPAARLEVVGIADPSPVWFGGQLHVFATEFPGRVIRYEGPDLTPGRHWSGVTVPFATVVGDELWLLAQGNVNGRRQPIVSRSRDAREWTNWAPMVPRDAVGNCTSPVMGPVKDGWVLLCVDEDQ